MHVISRRIALSVVALTLLFSGQRADAAGFAINEWGARSISLGNAVTAMADDPSAIVFNPAGLAQLEGLGIMAGVAVVSPSFGYTVAAPNSDSEVDIDGERQFFPIPALYATYRVHDRLAVGLGVYSSFGLGIKWPQTIDVAGQQTAWWGRSLIQEVDLKTAFITPTVALKLHERVLLGGGLNIVQAAVLLKRANTNSAAIADDINVELAAEDLAFGGNVGLLIKAIPKRLNIGVTYRSALSLTFEGDAVFSKADGSLPEGMRLLLIDSKGRAGLKLPHTFSFGVAAFPIDRLKVGAALDVITWSSYKELAIDLLDENGERRPSSTSEPKNWHNTIAARVGAEFMLTPDIPLRLGFVYDQSPVPKQTVSAELPDADRYEWTLGAGYRWRKLTADLGYMFLLTGDKKAAPEAPLSTSNGAGQRRAATYRASAHILALTLGYTFDI